MKRFVSIWFPYLATDWHSRENKMPQKSPFVLSTASHGKMIIADLNKAAIDEGLFRGMAVADARAQIPGLQVQEQIPDLKEKLLKKLAVWANRFSPFVSVDLPDGLLLDASGCSHLWKGDQSYIDTMQNRLAERGYTCRLSISDTIGCSWAIARFGKEDFVVASGQQVNAILQLPAAALRLEVNLVDRLLKLGLRHIKDLLSIPSPSLRRRFGKEMVERINQAIGNSEEFIIPIEPVFPYSERLESIEPISTNTGISIALENLLEKICTRLRKDEKGSRKLRLKCYRVDGEIKQIEIGTNRPSSNTRHLFKLFEEGIQTIEPELGIELFVLEAPVVEDQSAVQSACWESMTGMEDPELAELLDRVTGKFGDSAISRYLPAEHYWPERSIRKANSLQEQPTISWQHNCPRPVQLFKYPELIQVTAPIPDYPPMLFRYKGEIHTIKKADGPERLEQEWWIQEGEHRDYYYVEDQDGKRYWLFRLGYYNSLKDNKWFLHGIFP